MSRSKPPTDPSARVETLDSQHCKHCGAALPMDPPLIKLEDVPGQEHIKRAVEVSLAGPHAITFLGVGNAEGAVMFARYVRAHGGTAYAALPCICGNHGAATKACTCTSAGIARYHRRPRRMQAMNAEMIVEVLPTQTDKITAWASGRRGESESRIFARIAAAQHITVQTTPDGQPTLAMDCQRLLQAAVRQLQLDNERSRRVLSVATTIARLAASTEIRPAHLAEAIQHVRRDPTISPALAREIAE